MLRILVLINFLALFSTALCAKSFRTEMYESCQEKFPTKHFEEWRMPSNWYRSSTYPAVHRGTVCPSRDSYLKLTLRNLFKPPLHYFPLLPVPLLLCTDYQHYAVIVFCEIKQLKRPFEKHYNQSMILSVQPVFLRRYEQKALKCLHDFKFQFVKNMTKVRSINC